MMRSSRRRDGDPRTRSGWDVLPDPRDSSSKKSRHYDWGTKRRHDSPLGGRSSNQNARRSLSPLRGRNDDFDLVAADIVRWRRRRLDDRSPSSLSPELWAERGAIAIDRNFAGYEIHRGYQRSDPPSAARLGEGMVELDGFRHHRYADSSPLTRLPSPGADIGEHGRLIRKSLAYLDDVSSRTKFIPLSSNRVVHLEEQSAIILGSTIDRVPVVDPLRIGAPVPHDLMYHSHFKVPAYDEERGAGVRSLEYSPYSTEFSSQKRHLVAASSGAPMEDAFPGSFRGELHQRPTEGTLGQGIDFRSFRDEPLESGAYKWSDTTNPKMIAHPVAYERRGQNFSDYDWTRRAVHAGGDGPQYPEFVQTCKQLRRGSPTRGLHGTLEDQHYFEEDMISDYGEMEYVAHRRRPSLGDEVLHLGRNSRDTREDSECLKTVREARNARIIEMVEEEEDGRWTDQEIMEEEFLPSSRSAHFGHSRLIHNMAIFDSKRWVRKSDLESHRSMRDFDERSVPKDDPPKDSEEFKQLMHKAFLHFSKLLNGDSIRRDKYRQDRKSSQGFICYVCGSESKGFPQVHSLITHTFHSQKAGLQAEHLGLHKALCVVMGWSWTAPPDKVKSYKKKPDPDVEALKEDLIIWPPIMIIRNLSVTKETFNKKPNPVSRYTLKKILKKMKVDVGKVKIAGGKVGDDSSLLVKYLPTLSGLHEAVELHKSFKEKKRGREELDDASSFSFTSLEGNEEEWVYGYMGTVEDLDILDSDTKRRCILKSKKDIEDIADASIEAKP